MDINIDFILKHLTNLLILLFIGFSVDFFIKQGLYYFLKPFILRQTSIAVIGKIKSIRMILMWAIDVIIGFVLIMMVMSYFGVNLLPIITGAGIVGLILSLSAQSVVKDLFAGILIFLENQFSVGDVIQIGTLKGKVIKITPRITILEDNKNVIYIPHSQIVSVIKIHIEKKDS